MKMEKMESNWYSRAYAAVEEPDSPQAGVRLDSVSHSADDVARWVDQQVGPGESLGAVQDRFKIIAIRIEPA